MKTRSLAPALICAAGLAGLAGCAPDTLPPPEGSAASATPTTGGPPGGTPDQAQSPAAEQNTDTSAYRYDCSNGRTIQARYPDTDHAVVAYDGEKRRMHIAISADGSRYVGNDYEWWTRGTGHGAKATLFKHTDNGSTGDVIASCQEQ